MLEMRVYCVAEMCRSARKPKMLALATALRSRYAKRYRIDRVGSSL
jgi:hypothetical protein